MLYSKLQQFMIGRSGADQFSMFTMWTAIILWTIYLFTSWLILYAFSLVFFAATLFRMFSRQLDKRRAENTRFLNLIRPLRRKLSALRTRLKDKEHRYFYCPNCKQQMRVPKGKGRIQVTCRNCGITFEEKS